MMPLTPITHITDMSVASLIQEGQLSVLEKHSPDSLQAESTDLSY